MAKFELKLPQMGESVAEATLTTWLKEVGDPIELDEAVFEIATDKVDTEVPSEVEGVLLERLFEVDEVIKVGQTVAVIEVGGSEVSMENSPKKDEEDTAEEVAEVIEDSVEKIREQIISPTSYSEESSRFYSPLVKNIAREEGISVAVLDTIVGTGKDGRVTKNDILSFINKESKPEEKALANTTNTPVQPEVVYKKSEEPRPHLISSVSTTNGDEKIPLSRMGKLIAHHMMESINTSAHVQSFIEVDVTKVVEWRNRVKNSFEKREGEKLTFTPIFIEAIAKALKKFPMINISLEGDTIIKKKNINIGMAAALPDGNLIVPVIKNADQLNLVGMAKVVNDLANRARNNALKPDEIKEGTYTVTNVGSFGSVFGTPIINQPQVGILALGAIRKIPAVIETSEGDYIGIRSKMFLSHSYDHRVVNGALGGMFVKAVADYLEAWDVNREI